MCSEERNMVNKNMVVLAREARGITQVELASKIGVSNTTLSRMERGDFNFSDETIAAIAKATNYQVSFFDQDNEIYAEHLIYRKRDKVAQKLLTALNANINIQRMHVQTLIKELQLSSTGLPSFEVNDKNSPAVIAQKIRSTWKVSSGIVENMVELLERNGIAIISFDFGTERVDSRCVFTDDHFPIIIINNTLLGDRQRFSLAYQLGHLVMHTSKSVGWERDIAHEANLFASEFLMPENAIRKDFEHGVTVPLLGELKRKWKVSMISLLYRADDLGYLTPNQRRYLLQQFNEQKMRRREPRELDVPLENSSLVFSWIKQLKSKRRLQDKGIADLFHLNLDEFTKLYIN